MRIIFLACILALAPLASAQPAARIERGALRLENVPETPAEMRERLNQYVNTRSAAFSGFLPGGAILIATRFGETAQIHRVAAPMAARYQLTFFEEPVSGAEPRRGGDGDFFFTRDTGGDEQYQVLLFDAQTAQTVQYSEPGTRNESLVQSEDGARIAWALAGGDGNYDIYIARADEPASRRKVHEGAGALFPVAFSPDGARLLLRQYISIAESRLFLLDLGSGALREIAPELDVSFGEAAFIEGGRALVATSDENAQFLRLTRIDLTTGARTPLGPSHDWDVEEIEVSRDGRTLAYVVNEAGMGRLHLWDLRRSRTLPAPALPPGLVFGLAFDAAGSSLGFSFNSAAAPTDAYVYDLRARRLQRWTESEVGGLDPAGFVTPEPIAWTSFDGRAISGFLYLPRAAGPHPLVVDIHGGPEAQYRPGFSARIQYWVNELGVAVIAPNVRGSAGYGRDFLALDNADKREDAVRDIGALLDWVARDSRFDAARVAVYGGSYGGYMVLASMTHYNDRLAGAVDIVGIANFVTFLENTSGYRRDLRRAEYGDERDPQMRAVLARISPIAQAGRITKPIFIVHGANDPRVPLSEAEQVLAAVRRNGGEAWLMVAANEGHGFARRENQQAQREAEALFLRRILGLN